MRQDWAPYTDPQPKNNERHTPVWLTRLGVLAIGLITSLVGGVACHNFLSGELTAPGSELIPGCGGVLILIGALTAGAALILPNSKK